LPLGGFDSSLTQQPDGKLLVSAVVGPPGPTSAILRINPDGSMDKTFDGDGIRTFTDTAFYPKTRLTSDGEIVFVGDGDASLGYNFVLRQLLPSGAIDPAFNHGKRIIGDFEVDDVAITAQNSIMLVLSGDRISLERYTSTGSRDTMFGVGG